LVNMKGQLMRKFVVVKTTAWYKEAAKNWGFNDNYVAHEMSAMLESATGWYWAVEECPICSKN
jgi:hypothetical protein